MGYIKNESYNLIFKTLLKKNEKNVGDVDPMRGKPRDCQTETSRGMSHDPTEFLCKKTFGQNPASIDL